MEKIVQVNEEMIRNQLGDLVRNSVEETLNGLLDAEADRICNAQRYEHTEQSARIHERGFTSETFKRAQER
jgi:putative transposase